MKMIGLRNIRKQKGYSQLKVAMDLTISREALSYYENCTLAIQYFEKLIAYCK